jgi:chorismate mutase / prephenate dehydratase
MNTDIISEERQEIDRLDRQILELLSRRVKCALSLAEQKRQEHRAIYDPAREREVIDRLVLANNGELSESSIKRIFGEIISACRAAQEPIRVAFLGPEYTFSHMAVVNHFGWSVDFMPRATIADVFREVEHGRAEFGVAPSENCNNGAVGLTLDQWLRSDLKICGEILLPVANALMSRHEHLTDIKRVYSHPQPLGQCQAWLERNLPDVSLIETSSTAEAAARAAAESDAAAVGGEILADRHNLNVLARNIQDRPLNLTRFFIIGRMDSRPTGHDKTSILFIVKHTPGSLYAALKPLADVGINLARIESRPTRDRPWEYVFFVDLEGHQDEDRINAGLNGLKKHVDMFKVLGSYAMAETHLQDHIAAPVPSMKMIGATPENAG